MTSLHSKGLESKYTGDMKHDCRSRVSVLLMLLALAANASAAMIGLGDLLRLYEAEGIRVVYSTAVVDEAAPVSRPDRLTLPALRTLLAAHGLQLRDVGRRRWVITRTERSASAAVRQTDHRPVESIVVTASRYELEGSSAATAHDLDQTRMIDSPSFAGDSLRVIHRLPGAATLGVSTRPNIRGGEADEVLVVFDGVELIEPFHLRDFQSLFSSFNPRTIQRVEYFTGGFPARYGNKLSGVLDIAAEDAFEGPGGELGISNFWSSALVFTESDASQAVLSARRGNVDLALDVVNPLLGAPRFYDLYGSLSHRFDGGEGKISAFYFNDDVLLESDEERASSRVDNGYLWADWRFEARPGYETRTLLNYGRVVSKRLGERFSDRAVGQLSDQRELEVIGIRHTRERPWGEHVDLSLGVSMRHLSLDYTTRIDVARNTVAAFLGQPLWIDDDHRGSVDGVSASGFFTARIAAGARSTVQVGMRVDRQTYGYADTQWSPRLAMVYRLAPAWRLRISYGQFHQPHEIQDLRTADREIEYTRAQRSAHWIGGVEHQLSRAIQARAEVFYKSIRHPRPRYLNLFDPYRFTPEVEPDRIAVRAERAFSSGVELSVSGIHDHVEWNLNYTRSQVRDFENGRWIDRRWDQTHSVNGLVNWQHGPWRVGFGFAWHTGWRMTRIPLELAAAEPFIISQHRSNARLEAFGTVDARVSYTLQWPESSLQWFLEVTNLANRSNKGGVDYEISLEDDVYRLDEVDIEPVFPIVPNLGLVWRF